MDRYVLAVSFCQSHDECVEGHTGLEPLKQIYDGLVNISAQHSVERISAFPACSLSGSPSNPRWFFALQVFHRATQFCSSDWEELGSDLMETDSEEVTLTPVEVCLSSLRNQEADLKEKKSVLLFSFLLSGKALLDVLVLASSCQCPPVKDLLPLLGALKHMSCWHGAKITVVSEQGSGWQKVASSLGACVVEPVEMKQCIDYKEIILFIEFFKCHSVFSPALILYLSVLFLQFKHVLQHSLFSLSCTVTPIVQPAASQLSSQRWRDFLAKRPKSSLVPEVEVKGESAVYFLLIQGSKDGGSGICRVRMLHSDKQINGAAAMATVSALLGKISLSSTEPAFGSFLSLLPVLQGDSLLKRERKVTQVQTRVLQEYLKRRAKASTSTPVPVNDLKVILNQARELYLRMTNSTLPTFVFQNISQHQCDWPEKSVLLNMENLQRKKQKKRLGLYGAGSSDSLLGPKDNQRATCALLDAKELLKHFTVDGLPTGELQPLVLNRDNVMFQVSPDLSPTRFTNMPFSKASASHYHGIEFCLDNHRSLDRDQACARLQSRLIRFETQTTCSKEPCVLPFALSPAPSPAVMSEPGSVPDGETLQNNDAARIKRRSREADVVGGRPYKRLVKSESCDSLGSHSSGNSGTHPTVMSLRQQASRSRSTSSPMNISPSTATRRTTGEMNQDPTESKNAKESRSQKHNRMLQEVVAKTLKHHGITAEHERFEACSKRLFDISKFYLKDLKTSRGLHDEMKKAASSNVKQVIDWVLEKMAKK
uniref:MDM2 binding protein n=1 Tax=Gouania willdenowi TaxID=441366 RepID=A0A8C5N7M8_GOUWI